MWGIVGASLPSPATCDRRRAGQTAVTSSREGLNRSSSDPVWRRRDAALAGLAAAVPQAPSAADGRSVLAPADGGAVAGEIVRSRAHRQWGGATLLYQAPARGRRSPRRSDPARAGGA